MANLVRINNVRITFPKLFPGQEDSFGGKGDPYFSASFIMPKDHPDLDKLEAAITEAAKQKWPQKFASHLKAARAKDKLPLHDGDLKADKPYGAAYAGNFYISARNNAKTSPAPTVVNAAAKKLDSANDPQAPYSGCYVNVFLSIYAYQNEGEGIGASIAGVQFASDGERLSGGAVVSPADFGALPGADESGDKLFS